MKKLHLEQFIKVSNIFESYFSDSQHKKEEQDLINFMMNYFGSEYFDDFGNRKEDIIMACSDLFCISIMISYAVTKYPSFEKMVFKDDSFTHKDFYNLSYCLGFISLYNEDYLEFLSLYIEETRNISLSKALQKDWSEYNECMSEAEAYDYLSNLSLRSFTTILEQVNANTESKALLKKSIHDKDENTFIDTIIRNNIDLKGITGLINVITMIPKMGNLLEMVMVGFKEFGDTYSEEKVKHILDSCFNANELFFDDEMTQFAAELYQSIPKTESESFIPGMDWSYLFHIQTKVQAVLLYLHNSIKSVTTDIATIAKIENLIQNWPYFNWLNERILSGEIDPEEYELIEEPLKEFRDTFIQKLELPENILVGAKNTKEYLESNYAPDKWFCIRLYHALVDAHFLSYDEETFYSFIYRMSRDYKGEAEPIQMVWLGEARELYYFIYRFCNNSASKIWNKTAMFFCMPEGVQLRTNGVKNQAKPTPKIESIIKKFF